MIGPEIVLALTAVVAFCLWHWTVTERRLDRMRGERDALLQKANEAPNEDDIVMAMMIHKAFGAREGPGGS